MKKQLQGEVISNKMQKTVVVCVESWAYHPKYKKRYKVHKNYKAHNLIGLDPKDSKHNQEELKLGDRVIIEETRPISKEKKWRVIGKVNSKIKN
ncbi:MAG TPA: 30S ribosomal protein S17 [Candidatus Paceibacterota bacterium]|jgi:small subunit ribosomal protein S17|nr:30S ribosomal protein S17 [Candidatus Pacearchaeota archaeon]HPZ74992.1 30S ribosomal protein S17 [Candidatus Pacearchaeota archaeon]HQD89336.1 30S ribosomal protein S17 [Candidatus Pacearchaeota archaeon]HRR39563.1 30S ribosomal protein S17 [Candidatus Paceibacterota bacterium]